jgi:hypothetical protein
VIADAPSGLRGLLAPSETREEAAVLVSAPTPSQPHGRPVPGARAGAAPEASGRTAPARAGTVPLRSSDILLLIQRQNE